MSKNCHCCLHRNVYRKMCGKGEVEENDNMVTVGWIPTSQPNRLNELGKSDSGSN